MYSTKVTRHIRAPRPAVYRALLDADAIQRWRVPDGMTSQVHEFDAREGGTFRVSLTYDAPGSTGKSAARSDTYHGRFTRLVPDEQVTEVFEFESADPGLAGEMTMRTASASLRPSSNSLSTRLSPGRISHLSSQTSTPLSRRAAANERTNRSLSSLA